MAENSTQIAIIMDDLGQLQELNVHTGEVKPLELPIEQQETDFFKRFDAIHDNEGNLVYVPRGTSAEARKQIQGANYHFPYSPLLADQICQKVADGGLITHICKEPGMPPYPTLAKWRKFHPEFDDAYRQAVRDRAEAFMAKAIEEVEQSTSDRDEINLARLRADVYKYVAKVGDPDSFTEKQQVKADVEVKGFIVETGIRRPGDPGFNKDEARDVTPQMEGGDEES